MPTTPTDRKRLFCQLLKSTKRKNVDAVITEIERLGFFDAPGSSTEHNAIPGGLLIHSLNVYHVATEYRTTTSSRHPVNLPPSPPKTSAPSTKASPLGHCSPIAASMVIPLHHSNR